MVINMEDIIQVSHFIIPYPALMLVCARFRHVVGTKWGCKKYMNMKHLETMEQEPQVG